MAKAFFIDTSRCTACRGCQMACKEWKNLPATPTKQRGSHQNPEDLNAATLKLVRFEKEHEVDGKVVWNFFPDQCRHCVEAPCLWALSDEQKGAGYKDEATGAVVYTDETKKLPVATFDEMLTNCPYNIPRRDEATGIIRKCDMCINRVSNGLQPACVQVCLSGTMNFGEREAMLDMAKKRLEVVKRTFPDAQLIDVTDVCVIYLVTEKREHYHQNAFAMKKSIIDRRSAIV